MALATLSIDLLARMAGLETQFDRAAAVVEKNSRRMEKAFAGVSATFASLGVGLSVAGGVAWVKSISDAAVQVDRLAKVANAGNETFQRWAYGARTVGVEQDKLADILKDVNDKMGEFAATGGGPMKDFFDNIAPRVGVTAAQFRRLSGPEALGLYVQSLEKAGLSQQQMTFYMEAIASDATALLPLLRDNGRAMNDLGDEAERLGGVMDDKLVRASAELEQNLQRLQTLSRGVGIEIGNVLIPAVNELAAEFMAARGANLSFTESLLGIGLSNPLKSHAEQASELEDTLRRMREGAWYEKPWNILGGEEEEQRLERLLQYHRSMIQFQADTEASSNSGVADLYTRLRVGSVEYGAAVERLIALQASGELSADAFHAALARLHKISTETARLPPAAPVELTEEFKKQAEAGAELADSLIAIGGGLSGDFMKKWAMLTAAYKSGSRDLDQLVAAQAQLLAQQPAIKAATDEQARLADEYAKNVSAMLGPLEDQATALERQLETYGQTESQIQNTIVARLEEAKAIAQANGAGEEHIRFLEREIEARRRIASASAQVEVLEANTEAAQRAADEWERTAQTIEQSLTDALMRGFENGEDFGENLRTTLENMFKTLVLRPVIQAIVSPVSGAMNGLVNSLTGGLLGGGGGIGASAGGAGGMLPTNSLTNPITSAVANGISLGYANTVGYFGGDSIGALIQAKNIQQGAGLGTSGGSTLGAYGAGLSGALWAYNATGSYAMGVGGAAGSMAMYGGITSAVAGNGFAAGASGAAGLGAIPGWGWVAALVVGILGDVLAENPDPRVTYMMRSEIGDPSQWEDGNAYRESPFGVIGINNELSREVDSKDYRKQLDSLVAFDSMLASLMSADEIERVRTGMDGWMSSANRNDRDYRRNGELALTERMIDIAQAAGGEQWDELLQYLRTTTVGGPRRQESYGYGDTAGTYMTAEPVIPEGTTLADLFGFRAPVTDFASAGDAGAAALRTQLADLLGLPELQADLEFARANPDAGTLQADALARQLADVQAQIPQSLDALAAALESQGMDRAEIERIALAAANANPYGTGRDGNRLAKLSEIDSQALGKYLIQGLQVDDLQTMLGKLGQSIDRMDAREWMDASATTVTGEDGKPVEMDGYAVLMTNLSQSYATLYQTADDVWRQAQDNLKGMFDGLGVQLPKSTDEFKRLTEAQDLNTEAGRQLYQELWGLAPAFLEVAAAVEQTFAAISQSTAQTVEMFQLDIMSNAEKYAFIDDRITATLEQLETAVSPDQIAALYSKANEDLKTAWGLLQDDEKRRLQAEYIDRAYELESLSQERLSIAPLEAPEAQAEAQATAIGKAVEEAVSRALAGIATQMQSAGTDQSEAAAQLGAAVASLPERIVVEIRSQGGEVTLG